MLGEKLKKLRKSKGLTLEEVAELIGTSRQTIHRYENGIITNIPMEKIELLASVLGTDPASLIGWSDGKYTGVRKKRIPMLGRISCGVPTFVNEEREVYISSDGDIDADFCLTANGDSMIGARIYSGDIVFIKSESMVENGEIAVVIIDDEATLKRVYYYPDEEKLILSPENPKYPPLVFIKNELINVKIIGKAVAFQSNII